MFVKAKVPPVFVCPCKTLSNTELQRFQLTEAINQQLGILLEKISYS